jgi:uncharacterized protein YjbI with pentapeptide repeats
MTDPITADALAAILARHALWLADDQTGERANLTGADLRGANLSGADLRGADLRGAKNITCAGSDLRGYRFLGVRHTDQWYVAAGCRWFTIPQAIAHWDLSKDALARVGVIQVAAGK